MCCRRPYRLPGLALLFAVMPQVDPSTLDNLDVEFLSPPGDRWMFRTPDLPILLDVLKIPTAHPGVQARMTCVRHVPCHVPIAGMRRA